MTQQCTISYDDVKHICLDGGGGDGEYNILATTNGAIIFMYRDISCEAWIQIRAEGPNSRSSDMVEVWYCADPLVPVAIVPGPWVEHVMTAMCKAIEDISICRRKAQQQELRRWGQIAINWGAQKEGE